MLSLKKLVLLSAVLTGICLFMDDAKSASLESRDNESVAGDISAAGRKNAISLELLGRGGVYSFDYDRMLTEDIAVGAGLSHYSLTLGSTSAGATLIPVYANYYLNQGTSRFFATGGADLIFTSGSGGDGLVKGSGIAGVIGAGYEYRSEGGFLFRAAPYMMLGNASGAWLGLSLGYAM